MWTIRKQFSIDSLKCLINRTKTHCDALFGELSMFALRFQLQWEKKFISDFMLEHFESDY